MSVTGKGETGALLLEIQGFDTRIQGLRREVEGLPGKHRLDELRGERERLEGAFAMKEEELSGLEAKQHKLDGELDLLSLKVKTEEEKLYSGSIMNPKELSAIQAEIFSLRRKRDEMETEDLEMMESIDALRLEKRGFESETGRAAAEEQAAITAYDDELAELEEEIADLEVKRDDLKGRLDSEVKEIYDRLLGDKGGLAVVRMERGRNCGGCHIEFSSTQVDRFQHEEELFRCDSCRRILVR